MKELQELKKIFLSDDIDGEDYQENLQQITEWEQTLLENENLVGWQEHDITKSILTQARESYADISLRLAKDRNLTEQERMSLFAKQDAMLWLIQIQDDNAKEEIARIQADIKRALKMV